MADKDDNNFFPTFFEVKMVETPPVVDVKSGVFRWFRAKFKFENVEIPKKWVISRSICSHRFS